MVDFFPFENGFHISAGTFSDESAQAPSEVGFSNDGRTYVGVGWKKLLDDARRIDLNVDVGTFLEFQNGALEGATGAIESKIQSVIGDKEDLNEQPVISLGIQFRF